MENTATPSLTRFLKNEGAVLQKAISGSRVLKNVRSICATDRWNSFDRFHETTDFLTESYDRAGAKSEVYRIPTGGEAGTGRWIIREASDIRRAVVHIVSPVKRKIIDYAKNPWQVIQWSAATPREGLRSELVVIDSEEELTNQKRGLKGKTVLTRMDAREWVGRLSACGAVAVITDKPIVDLSNATAWTKFGWGAIPLDKAATRLVGLVLSEKEGRRLRALHDRHGRLTLHLNVDVRPYLGEHDLVSGIVKGAGDPQDELWVLAHSAEPGAIDNASGVAVCLEAARAIEAAIRSGKMQRPRRSIRFLSGYECYSFFHYTEFVHRYQTPLAGLCIDTVGARPDICEGQLSWRATIPMSATFVDRIGEAVTRSAIRRIKPGYHLVTGPFVSTSDTLEGDPKYGFPCPWITTHYRKGDKPWKAYHSSADVPRMLSPDGLATSTLAGASYLVYLANAGSREIVEIAESETRRTIDRVRRLKDGDKAEYLRLQHHVSLDRLKRWIWEGSRSKILSQFSELEKQVRQFGPRKTHPRSRHVSYGRVPRRTRSITPTAENTREPIATRIRNAHLPGWALFWANGDRTIAEITRLISQELGKEISPDKVSSFFDAHEDLGYAKIVNPDEVITKKQLRSDLGRLGLKPGMTVIVHSSLSAIGHVSGGADSVVDVLLAALGKKGTLVMPSFNHRAASVYNPRTSPTTNGAIPDAFWRRQGVDRSNHPTHAVAASGPLARDLVADHVEGGIWTDQDPIARLIRAGGYILSIGVTHTSSTAYHIAELSVPCGCIDPFGSRDRIVDETGDIRIVDSLAWRDGRCPVDPAKLDSALSNNRLQRLGKVGGADAILIPARLVYETRRRHLRNACPTCSIKPKAHR